MFKLLMVHGRDAGDGRRETGDGSLMRWILRDGRWRSRCRKISLLVVYTHLLGVGLESGREKSQQSHVDRLEWFRAQWHRHRKEGRDGDDECYGH